MATLEPVSLLIPHNTGYAVTEGGSIFSLTLNPNGTSSGTALTGNSMDGTNRQQYAIFKSTPTQTETIILVDGGTVQKIQNDVVSDLGGSPPKAKFVGVLDTRVILAGHNQMDFQWSESENAESYPDENFNRVTGDGEHLLSMRIYNRDIYFFKTHSTEIWISIGSDPIFVRRNFIEVGIIAPYSVVEANNTLYFFDDNRDFRAFVGIDPKIISDSYRRELEKLEHPETVYGYHFAKEYLIRWFAKEDHKCFVYDYRRNQFSEDNEWRDANFRRMRINSYMEMDNNAYFGDTEDTGKIYHWDRKYKSDNGQEIRVYRKFSYPLSQDGTTARVNNLRFRVKRGVAVKDTEGNDPPIPDPKMMVRWRFDRDGYSNLQHLPLGKRGDLDPFLDIRRLGIGKEMELELTETDAVEYLVTDAFVSLEALGR